MSLGFVVVAAVGFFVLAPLVLGWVSADPARWGRVEAVLGREPRDSERAARWALRFWLAAVPATSSSGSSRPGPRSGTAPRG
jgi:hypothetical protein